MIKILKFERTLNIVSMDTIKSVLNETRKFAPPKSFTEKTNISKEEFEKLYRESIEQPEKFWARMAQQHLSWYQDFYKTLEWNLPFVKWFHGGKINACYNCVDRHISDRKDKTAIIWEGENFDAIKITYGELLIAVCRLANALKELGIKRGDRIALYMPMIPELAVSVLACARIGAVHSVIFGGFSAQSIIDRVNDAEAKIIITADGCYRKGKVLPLKETVDEAVRSCATVEKVLVVERTHNTINWNPAKDIYYDEIVTRQPNYCEPEQMDSEDLLFLLYTSGTTGKPKGIMHTTAGYLLGTTLTTKYIFDLKDEDIFWCTADIGWITGHSYIVYGTLSNGATVLMYEGAPSYPDFGRFWDIIQRHKVNIFYTAPTAIRTFIAQGSEFPDTYDLSSLRLLGTVGEPINPEAWIWYHKKIGKEKCPIVDTWWQTETGAIMCSPIPGFTETKPGSCTIPFLGIDSAVVDENGNEVSINSGGKFVIRKPWPAMTRGIWKDPERFKQTYWSTVKGMYFTGDGARKDEDGYFWVMGRIDDVINVSGHRLGTMEVESALVSHHAVAEAAVVPIPHDIKGTAIVAFVTLEKKFSPSNELEAELKNHVTKEIGALARPEKIRFTQSLPKTRSGKIMRRLLKELAANGTVKGDTTTLEDFSVIAKLSAEE